MKYVALLRGVNVGGITIKSADLKALFVEQGFTAVRTVLASGNVVFDSPERPATLKPQIEKALADRFGYEAWIVLVTQESLANVTTSYPFERSDEVTQPWVIFGSDSSMLDELVASAPEEPGPDRVQRGDGVIYWEVPRGSTVDSPFGKVISKPKYKRHITTRNLRTVEKLLD